jgi:hypothetical protein
VVERAYTIHPFPLGAAPRWRHRFNQHSSDGLPMAMANAVHLLRMGRLRWQVIEHAS